MKKVSNEFINLSKKIKTQDLKLTINDGELTVQEVHLLPINMFNAMPVSLLKARKKVIAKELKYSFEGQLFKTIMQQVEITVKNASEIKGKNVHFQYGIQVNNKFEYVDMGEYYIKDVEDDKNKKELVVTGYDKMLNFMIPFKQSDLQLTYPCKMSRLVNRIGEVCGVELYSTDFYNSELIVEEDFFTIQELTYRDVLEKVAQTTLTTIFIKENKLYLCKEGDSVQTLDTSFLSNLIIGEKFGPVNALVLGRGSVEDNIEAINLNSINENGRCEIRFDENEFVDNKREQVINQMLQQISGLEYYAVEASNLGLLWLEPCDVIIVKDREENGYKSIYLRASVTINTGIKGEMESNIPETTNTEYKVTTKEEKKTLKVERLAKKNQGLIQDIIEQNTENSQKLTKVEQTVDSISQTVKETLDFIEEVEGIKTITLENCAEGDLLELHIYGNNTIFDHLRVSNNLIISDNLLTYGDGKIVVKNKDGNEKVYELGITNVLRQNGQIYDEYILEKGNAKVIRRIAKDGSVLAKEIVEDLGEFCIKISEGKNTITIQNYTARIKAKIAITNEFTDLFATRVEMNSKISQTAEAINTEVKKKVDENEFGTLLSQNAYYVRIAWNNNNKCVQFEGNGLTLYDGEVSENAKRAVFDFNGNSFYRDGYHIGNISTSQSSVDKTNIGLAFNLDVQGKFMLWGQRDKNEGSYTSVLCYSRANSFQTEEGLHIGADMYGHWRKLNNFAIGKITAGGYTGFSGDIPIVNSISDNGNGTISWKYSYLHIINGIVTGYSV
ncbi:MAG: hypothetical protein HFJ40_05805 [Clostridia bacterium]|nr:hypothetical protein [Clostridia bacterium]